MNRGEATLDDYRPNPSMTPPTAECARIIRDGGIDAVAALDAALAEAIVGLAPEQQAALRQAFAHAMGEVIDATIMPSVKAFPELEPDDETWRAVVKSQAKKRASVASQLD